MKGLIFHMINNENDDKIINLANKSKFFEWTNDNVAEAFRLFNTNSHQLFYKHENYKTNKTYFNINKCARIKKSWKCHYYGCLPCMFEYLNYNYDILKNELKPKLQGRYPCYLITYRIPLLNDDLTTNYKLLLACVSEFKYSLFGIKTNYEKFLDEIGYVASITCFECPFSYADNVHVMHLHECLIAQNPITKSRSLEVERNFNADYQNSILSVYNNTLNGNYFSVAYDFTHETKIYEDDQRHYTAIQLLNDFNSPEYLSNPYKLLRGFEPLLDKSIQIDKLKTVSPYVNAIYSFNRGYYLNFIDNLPNKLPEPFKDLAIDKTINYKSSATYQSAWLTYGSIGDLDLRKYFRLAAFKGMSLAQIRKMKEDNQIKEIIKYRKDKYEGIVEVTENLINFIKFKENANIIELNEKWKKMPRKADTTYFVTMNDRYYQFKIGYFAGYIDTLFEMEQRGIEMRQLINHDSEDLPKPQTDNEIVEDIQMSYDKFLSNPTC